MLYSYTSIINLEVSANTTLEDPVKLEKDEETRKKREVIDDKNDEDDMVDSEEKCRVDMWRCLSRVIEGGLHYIDNPEGLYGYVSMYHVSVDQWLSEIVYDCGVKSLEK